MKTLLTILALTGALTISGTAKEPVNDKCPVCGKAIRLIFHSQSKDGQRVAFATAECQEKFDKSPSKYNVKPKP
jgi:YHS domain-containing protein